MITLIILFGSFVILVVLSHSGIAFRNRSNPELAAYAMAFFLCFFGLSHFYKYDELLPMIPNFLPFPGFIVYFTGVIEIILAVGLMIPKTRRWSSMMLVLYFIAVFPANIIKAMNALEIEGSFNSPVMSWVRLLFQPIFIAWALYCSKEEIPS